MSDKVKEFMDVPQQFVREGNLVCTFSDKQHDTTANIFLTWPIVPHSVYKAIAERLVLTSLAGYKSPVLTDSVLQNSCKFPEQSLLASLSWVSSDTS